MAERTFILKKRFSKHVFISHFANNTNFFLSNRVFYSTPSHTADGNCTSVAVDGLITRLVAVGCARETKKNKIKNDDFIVVRICFDR